MTRTLCIRTACLSLLLLTALFPAAALATSDGSDNGIFCNPYTYVTLDTPPAGASARTFHWKTPCLGASTHGTWQAVRVIDRLKPYVDDPSNYEVASEAAPLDALAAGTASWTTPAGASGMYAIIVRMYDGAQTQLSAGAAAFMLEAPTQSSQPAAAQPAAAIAPATCADGSSSDTCTAASTAGPTPQLVQAVRSLRLTPSRRVARPGQVVGVKVAVRNAVSARTCVSVPVGSRIVSAPGARITRGRTACWQIARSGNRFLRVKVGAKTRGTARGATRVSAKRLVRVKASATARGSVRSAAAVIRVAGK